MGWIKSEEGQKRRAKFDKEYKEEMSGGWQEKEVYNVTDAGIEEVQSTRCPHCRKILTMPYIYYFYEFPYCPSCGKKIKDDARAVKTTSLNAVKVVIDRAGIPQSKVAKITGLAPQTVSNYYVGRTYPNLANFALICKACGAEATIWDRRIAICQKKST